MPNIEIRSRAPFLIVIPNWNRWAFLKQSLVSLLSFGPFNLIHSLIIYDNHSEDIDLSVINSNLIPIVTGDFPNSNFCLDIICNSVIDPFIKYVVKIDSDIVISQNFFQSIFFHLISYPQVGTVFFAKHTDSCVNLCSSPHGGVFATRLYLLQKYNGFPLEGQYPGCEMYHKFVIDSGFKLSNIPAIASDLSYTETSLVRSYIEKGWMRDPF